jgi:hypothetical protein
MKNTSIPSLRSGNGNPSQREIVLVHNEIIDTQIFLFREKLW